MVPVVNELSTHLLCTGNEFVAMPETCVCDDLGNSFKNRVHIVYVPFSWAAPKKILQAQACS